MTRTAPAARTAALLLAAGCQSSEVLVPPPAAPKLETPTLTVLVVVDQLRGDELAAHGPLFKYGLRRLLDEGRWYTRAMHGHARTETAAGHATIATGLYPRLHGVVDKAFHDRDLGKTVGVCDLGVAPDTLCSPRVLREPTVGDRLKEHEPKARVVSLAMKDRSATLLGGKSADLVAWSEPWKAGQPAVQGRSADGPRLPGWLERTFSRVASPERISRIWELPRLPEPYKSWIDAGPSESDAGHGTTFPHRLPEADLEQLYWAWFTTPDADRALVDLARESLVDLELGQRGVPDLLLLSFSGFDAIGHAFGPDSLERVASFIELDRQLGDLLDGLTEQTGAKILLALTSDHGSAPVLDVARRQGHPSRRVDPDELLAPVADALRKELGPGDWVGQFKFPFLSLEVPEAQRQRAAEVAAVALRSVPGVHRAYVVSGLRDDADPLERMVFRNAAPGRSGDVAVVLDPYLAPRSHHRDDTGSEHGSPWEYDRHVPIILWGAGVSRAKIDTEVAVIDLARTLTDRWGLPPDTRGGVPLP